LIALGQDECIFKQFLCNGKAWHSKSGKFKLTPKDDGSGLMVSAFVSRPFGFGFPLFDQELLEKVNKFREGKKYQDTLAALKVNKKEEKLPLATDPFIRLFEYGNAEGKEGYWSYDHMVLQQEDILDVLTVTFGDKFDYLFVYDHSCGHDRMRTDTINANNMNGSASVASKPILMIQSLNNMMAF
jgi:hypothetical protein